MLSEQRQLLGWRRWLQTDDPAIRHAMNGSEPGDLLHRRFAERGGEVLAIEVSTLVSRHQLWPLLRKHRHEVLARAVAEMQHARPEVGGAGGSCGFDHCFEPISTVG